MSSEPYEVLQQAAITWAQHSFISCSSGCVTGACSLGPSSKGETEGLSPFWTASNTCTAPRDTSLQVLGLQQ